MQFTPDFVGQFIFILIMVARNYPKGLRSPLEGKVLLPRPAPLRQLILFRD